MKQKNLEQRLFALERKTVQTEGGLVVMLAGESPEAAIIRLCISANGRGFVFVPTKQEHSYAVN